MNAIAPYIGLWPAIRLIVAEKLPGGAEHAAEMTDALIKAGVWKAEILGGVWKAEFRDGKKEASPGLKSFRGAVQALESAFLDPSVHVLGVDMTSGSAVPRQIEAHERGNHRLYVSENRFVGQPPFDAPQFCVADLRRVIPKFDDRSSGINERKRLAVAAEIARIGVAALDQMRQKDREHQIIEEVKGRRGLKVSARYVRGRFGKAKEQS